MTEEVSRVQKSLRILVIHSSAELYGSDRSLLDFVRLCPEQFEVTVVLPESGPLVTELRSAGIKVLVGDVGKIQRGMLSPGGFLRLLSSMRRSLSFLGSLHQSKSFDLVYSNSVAILGGALCALRWGVPHVWHVREILAGSASLTAVFRKIVRYLSVHAICNSAETMAWIADGLPGRVDRYSAVWNGFDLVQRPTDRSAVRHTLGVTGDAEVLFVLVGRINAWKGQSLLVEAFSDLVRSGVTSVRLAIVGSAFAGQEHYEEELHALIARSGCEDRIGVFPFRADIDAVWDAADVAVVPSIEPEPFGRVAVEAMAFSKPVVAAAHGGLIEIVEHEVTGLLVTPRSRSELALALGRLATDPALRDRMGSAGRVRQLVHFSVQGYVDKVATVLLRAAKSN